ncbi:uncharacterized protein PV09_05485 [Verruconis gallopava]|uniref:Increased loss of mitochondrial DNA protein 1 n=1 Tax=Verruconis gallopava TaxID=253628 RepID=A0A0D2A9I7_9PEZI|nr:uncharacterized protein PV09_05485 [Verruconis gallopava]KIW03265.1 hypothetical protein PV09_05485 [Verruconis gallopava]
MALFSAFGIVRAIALLHITLAYYFLVNPRMIAEQNFVLLMGNAMDMPHVSDFGKATPVTAFLALVLGFFGISDLIAVSITEPIAIEYWSAVTPLRLLVLFPLTAYTYLHQPDYFGKLKGKMHQASPSDNLKNSLTFSFCFIETVLWFWVYVSLKEQRQAAAQRLLRGQKRASG